ncbi:MAG: cytochrome-c oxidase, cbb3-type subunit III [Gammaproteobacteria bacterium]|nr:cytochrome-c oxidase, cbb3-type subunit III [Gammaproteobacteria bacterium]
MSEQKHTEGSVQTTGHAWDGDLQEFNNPLPRWWVWAFYATVIFAIVYWIIYPSWPMGGSYLKGVMNTITYENDKGEEVTTHWNTRALLAYDMKNSDAAVRQSEYLEKVTNASYSQIAQDPEMMAFTRSYAKGLFGDNCAACHQQGGVGVIGKYPNLVDDSWLYGGTYVNIEQSIQNGRRGNMPNFESLSDKQKDDLSEYVLSLSGHEVNRNKAQSGAKVFQANCVACHGADAEGNTAIGAANLTDRIWTVADVPGASNLEAKKVAIKQVINNGISRHMPAWSGRLSGDEIKLLTVYVHSLGGGQ